MENVEERMEQMRTKVNPDDVEMKRYIRYAINVQKLMPEEVYEKVAHWDKEKVEKTIKKVERENQQPKPKRYYVSLKEPLED